MGTRQAAPDHGKEWRRAVCPRFPKKEKGWPGFLASHNHEPGIQLFTKPVTSHWSTRNIFGFDDWVFMRTALVGDTT